jgi:hypothetical protein
MLLPSFQSSQPLSLSREWFHSVSGSRSDCEALNFGLYSVHVTLAQDVGQLNQLLACSKLWRCQCSSKVVPHSTLGTRQLLLIFIFRPLHHYRKSLQGPFDTRGRFYLTAAKENPFPSKIPNITAHHVPSYFARCTVYRTVTAWVDGF